MPMRKSRSRHRFLPALLAALSIAGGLLVPGPGLPSDAPASSCAACAAWNAPQRPFRIYGNTYYVGPRGLAAILVTSPKGHVLIDAGLPESADQIAANIRALGFEVEDIRLILNSHAHFDHAGGIAAVQRASGADVVASPPSRAVLLAGAAGPDDPQYGQLPSFPAVAAVGELADGETVRVGPLALTAHFTPGHTPGGTTWTWRSCAKKRCLDLVYADSQTPIAAQGFRFTDNPHYPDAIADFERGHAVLEKLSCDILVTTHPEASQLWERLQARRQGTPDALIDAEACRRYARQARKQLATRLAQERGAQP